VTLRWTRSPASQLVYLPGASVAARRRQSPAGSGESSVFGRRSGFRRFRRNGRFLVAANGHDTEKVADLLSEEMLHSARRKGCTSVEVMLTPDSEYFSSWQDHGFTKSAANLYRAAVAVRAPTSR